MVKPVNFDEAKHKAIVGVIGGTGIYKLDFLSSTTEVQINTPFGSPSDVFILATVHGIQCAFLPRHSSTHSLLPSEINYQANVYGMKMLGVQYLISINAVGSLREDYAPGDLVVVDQVIDQTKMRGGISSFFGKGVVAHTAFGTPTCPELNKIALNAIKNSLPNVAVHPKGTMVVMEGPIFSTHAESLFHKSIGGDLIGMTFVTESKLAKEAEMANCSIANITDYDSWKETDHVDLSIINKILEKNASNAQKYLYEIIKKISENLFVSSAHSALANAIVTTPDAIPQNRKKELYYIIRKYINCD